MRAEKDARCLYYIEKFQKNLYQSQFTMKSLFSQKFESFSIDHKGQDKKEKEQFYNNPWTTQSNKTKRNNNKVRNHTGMIKTNNHKKITLNCTKL